MKGLLLLLLFATTATHAECKLSGKVIKVADGDTITVLDKTKNKHKIRLAGIDAPERGQPYGKKAGKTLRSLVQGKLVCINWYKNDKYKRKVAKVVLDSKDINLSMVEHGLAWHYKKWQKEQSAPDRKLYAQAEDAAKQLTLGLWSEPTAVAPWDWRSGKRPVKVNKQALLAKQRTAVSPASGFSCSVRKRYCREMTNCAEARFYLNECGLQRLDRDKDSVPCESICGNR